MFSNYEKVENIIMRPTGLLTIKNVSILGRSARGDNRRLDAIYDSNEYISKKYSNLTHVKNLNIDSMDFLVFSYNSRRNFEEIYMSYPNIYKIVDLFKLASRMLSGDEVFFYNEDGELTFDIAYKNTVIKAEGFSSGKSIYGIFDFVERYNVVEKGFILYLNNDDYEVDLNLEEVNSILHTLSNFDLVSASLNLINSVMMTRLFSLLMGEEQENNFKKKEETTRLNRRMERKKPETGKSRRRNINSINMNKRRTVDDVEEEKSDKNMKEIDKLIDSDIDENSENINDIEDEINDIDSFIYDNNDSKDETIEDEKNTRIYGKYEGDSPKDLDSEDLTDLISEVINEANSMEDIDFSEDYDEE